MVDERLKEYFEDAKAILDNLGIEYGPVKNVTVNTRAKSRWGQCKYNGMTFDISISSMLLQKGVSYKAVMDTVLHELLHCHEDRLCHTGEWKRCAELVNDCYDYNIKRVTSAAEKNIAPTYNTSTVKYKVICNKCGTVTKYKRMGRVIKLLMKNPEGTCRCNVCGSTSFSLK